MRDKEIISLFQTLEIPAQDYPQYDDPLSFAQQIKQCALWKEDAVQYCTGVTTREDSKYA